MKKLLVGLTVLLLHTAAAHAQQILPEPVPPQVTTPPPPPPPPPAPAAAPAPQAQPELPPVYAPPPGYAPPAARPVYGPPPTYGAPPAYQPRAYGPPPYQPYRYAPYRYAPPPYYTYPPPQPQRDVLNRPFTLGGGIGFGGLVFEDHFTGNQVHQNGLAYTFRLGFGLEPGLLLLWDVEGAAANYGSSTISQTANLLALQIFLTHRWFIKGGFGLADAVQDNQPTQWGAAAMGGIGYELVQGWNWSFDVEATITGTHLNSNGEDQTWTNWSLVNFALNFF